MITITTKKELNKLLTVYDDDTCWKIGGYEYAYADGGDIITRAISREAYILEKYNMKKVEIEEDIKFPSLEDILSELTSCPHDVNPEVETEFKSMVKKLLDKYNMKKQSFKIEYELVEEYNIKPLIKNILESRISKIEKDKLLKLYKEKLERM